MTKEDAIISMLQNLVANSNEQFKRQAQLEDEIRELKKQNEKLQLNIIAMNPMYSDEQRRDAMSKLAAIKEQEEKQQQFEDAFIK